MDEEKFVLEAIALAKQFTFKQLIAAAFMAADKRESERLSVCFMEVYDLLKMAAKNTTKKTGKLIWATRAM